MTSGSYDITVGYKQPSIYKTTFRSVYVILPLHQLLYFAFGVQAIYFFFNSALMIKNLSGLVSLYLLGDITSFTNQRGSRVIFFDSVWLASVRETEASGLLSTLFLCSCVDVPFLKWSLHALVYPQGSELITSSVRDKTVRWLWLLNKDFEFLPETFSLAVALLDRFLSLVKV